MSAEQNRTAYRRFIEEVMHQGRLEVIDELVAADGIDHGQLPGMAGGREGVKLRIAMLRTAFPDLRLTIDLQMAEGDLLASRFTVRGTHTGPFMDLPASGRQVTVTGIDITRWRDGQMAEHWAEMDMLGLMQQLGAIPTAAPAAG